MALGEFSVIERYFDWPAPVGALGVGDDAARLEMPPGAALVVCKDLLVEGRHFFSDAPPHSLGHKALAVNLSDLAAMGARPLGCLLGLGLPSVDKAWLAGFSRGFRELSAQSACPLLGGDTVRSEAGVVISVTALGTLPIAHPGLRRSAALTGDDIWVSGYLGAADVALAMLKGELPTDSALLEAVRPALDYPVPRLSLGLALLPLARAAIDVSDGLTQDLGHLLDASHCGAVLDPKTLPVHPALVNFDPPRLQHAILHGGDVYELCFTAEVAHRERLANLASSLSVPLTRIGHVTSDPGLWLKQPDGALVPYQRGGFDHFAGSG